MLYDGISIDLKNLFYTFQYGFEENSRKDHPLYFKIAAFSSKIASVIRDATEDYEPFQVWMSNSKKILKNKFFNFFNLNERYFLYYQSYDNNDRTIEKYILVNNRNDMCSVLRKHWILRFI